MPTMAPRAVASQCGAKRPENAGTKYTPPLSSTPAARVSTSGALPIMPRLSRSHWISEPVTAIEPSSAYTGFWSPMRYATVVSRPLSECTGSSPVLISMKLPVPYVFLAWPTSKHAWPKVAACWSPRMPVIGVSRSSCWPDTVPTSAEELTISGSMDIGMPMSAQISSFQSRVSRFISMVREALVTSVTCRPPSPPPVRFHTSHESVVPKMRSPFSAASRAPSTFSRIQATLGPEKYVASGSPTRSL